MSLMCNQIRAAWKRAWFGQHSLASWDLYNDFIICYALRSMARD